MPVIGRPVFVIQIVRTEDGAVATIPGGGPLEANLVELITSHVMNRGVNWKSYKHVAEDVREGVKSAIMSMKEQTAKLV